MKNLNCAENEDDNINQKKNNVFFDGKRYQTLADDRSKCQSKRNKLFSIKI